MSRHLAGRLRDAQRAAKRENRPIPARLPPDTPVLDVPRGLVKILNRDLVAAGIARVEKHNGKRCVVKRDERGRSFDVHGFRHTFNSLLAAAGVPLRTRQVLMRHASSGTLTDDVYSDPKVLDLRGALDRLPALPLDRRPSADGLRATGTAPSDAPSLVAPDVAPTAGDSGQLSGAADESAVTAAAMDALSKTVASGAAGKSNERSTSVVNRSSMSGRQDLNLRPSAPHADALARLRHAPRVHIQVTPPDHVSQPRSGLAGAGVCDRARGESRESRRRRPAAYPRR